jgi:hypothetical protein
MRRCAFLSSSAGGAPRRSVVRRRRPLTPAPPAAGAELRGVAPRLPQLRQSRPERRLKRKYGEPSERPGDSRAAPCHDVSAGRAKRDVSAARLASRARKRAQRGGAGGDVSSA